MIEIRLDLIRFGQAVARAQTHTHHAARSDLSLEQQKASGANTQIEPNRREANRSESKIQFQTRARARNSPWMSCAGRPMYFLHSSSISMMSFTCAVVRWVVQLLCV